jgi:hypothetical protein
MLTITAPLPLPAVNDDPASWMVVQVWQRPDTAHRWAVLADEAGPLYVGHEGHAERLKVDLERIAEEGDEAATSRALARYRGDAGLCAAEYKALAIERLKAAREALAEAAFYAAVAQAMGDPMPTE